jgi:hypothetical protein
MPADMAAPWISPDLRSALGKITAQQAAAIVRIVQAELDGRPITSLLDGPDKIAARSTYYGTHKRTGWRDRPEFNAALAQARSDYRAWLMETGTEDAMVILARAARPAARELERQVTGDLEAVEILGQEMERAIAAGDMGRIGLIAHSLEITGMSQALPHLRRALAVESLGVETYNVVVAAIGSLANPVNPDKQKAGFGILDRADAKTAAKGTVVESGAKRISFDVSGLPADVLKHIAHAGQ